MQTDPPNVNILMVDDNESNLLALETILQGNDRTLVRAGSGEEALQFLLHKDAAVILLDVRMPGISGLETAELIRGRKKTQDVPIIFLTAYDSADKDDLSKGYLLGAVDYIIKPLDPEALKSKVAVFVELYKKNEQVKHQAELLHEKNIQLENANVQRLGKLVDLGQRLGAERDPDTLIQIFCDSARDILGAKKAFVRMIEQDGEVRYVTGFAADLESTSESETTGIDEQTLTAFSSTLNTVRVPNSQFARSGKVFRSNPSLHSLLSAPISQFEHTIGWLYAIDKQEASEFSEADERLAMTLAGQLAVFYENARLYDEAREHASVLQAEVAERKRAQEEKEKLLLSEKAARLEAEAAQRLSSQLLMREEEARADAEAANRLKDEFLATVSHELRTPLNSILGWSQLMRSGKLDDEAEGRALTTIERNTRALAQIIDDLLDVSRIISGKLRLEVGPIELEPVVAAALDTIKPASDAKNIELHVSLDSSTGTILGDPNRLQQVVWNLLTNAIKFTPRGGRVEVRLERIDSSAMITVSDTGEGISEDFLPYIFDRFRQADSTFTRLHGGLGLGLAIVRHLVEMHGGSVNADSPGKGKGATFSVTFPVATATWGSRSEPREAAEWHPSAEEDFELAGLTVLVVDDDLDARELLGAMLRERGADVISVSSSLEALEQLASRTNGCFPDVLVSDIGMPEEDGLELITKVRSMEPEQGGRIPAIALTAYARDEDRDRVLDAGFQRHLAKPVDPPVLAATIADLARFAAKAGSK